MSYDDSKIVRRGTADLKQLVTGTLNGLLETVSNSTDEENDRVADVIMELTLAISSQDRDSMMEQVSELKEVVKQVKDRNTKAILRKKVIDIMAAVGQIKTILDMQVDMRRNTAAGLIEAQAEADIMVAEAKSRSERELIEANTSSQLSVANRKALHKGITRAANLLLSGMTGAVLYNVAQNIQDETAGWGNAIYSGISGLGGYCTSSDGWICGGAGAIADLSARVTSTVITTQDSTAVVFIVVVMVVLFLILEFMSKTFRISLGGVLSYEQNTFKFGDNDVTDMLLASRRRVKKKKSRRSRRVSPRRSSRGRPVADQIIVMRRIRRS